MHFYSIQPSTFVINNAKELQQLEKLLKKVGLTLTPLRTKKEIWDAVYSDNIEDTQTDSSDEELEANELAHHPTGKATNSVA